MDDLWWEILRPTDEPMFLVLCGDPYFLDYSVVYQPIPLVEYALMQCDEFEPEEDPEENLEEDTEEEMEEEHEEDPKEDMDEDELDEVIMLTDSKSSSSPPPTPTVLSLDFHSAKLEKLQGF